MQKLFVGLLAMILAGAIWAEDPYAGIDVGERNVAVIDIHLHTGEWDKMPPGFHERLAENVPTGFKWTMGPISDWMLGTDIMLGQLEDAGIYGGGLFALYSPHTTGLAPNEFVAERVAESGGRLWGFASIRWDDLNNSDEELAAFEQVFADYPQMAGIKLAHAHQQVRLDDERAYPVYEISQRLGKPMYLHTGSSPNPGTRFEPPYSDPAYLEDAIRKYPGAIFILGHTGYDSKGIALTYTDSAIRLAQQYDNVYMEPGALGATRAENLIDDFVVRLKEGNVLHKVIYGSDGPQFPGYVQSHLENYVAAMQRNGYTADEMEMVLSGNFARVFGIELPPLAGAAKGDE